MDMYSISEVNILSMHVFRQPGLSWVAVDISGESPWDRKISSNFDVFLSLKLLSRSRLKSPMMYVFWGGSCFIRSWNSSRNSLVLPFGGLYMHTIVMDFVDNSIVTEIASRFGDVCEVAEFFVALNDLWI